ncbi:MAG: CAP domain-containing protein [Chloroflexota bacterium]|nr:CAP domain-containing protein [Chloroflexota bacterium]
MRFVSRGLCLAAIVLAFATHSNAANAEPPHDALLAAVNAYRASRGLATVAASPTLQAAAQFMADDFAQHGAPAVPHRSSDGRMPRQRMADAGYPIGEAFTSEIIAWGATAAEGAMRLWLNSPPHWAELNDGRYRAAGLGVSCSGALPCVWVITFGSVVDATYGDPKYHTTFYAQSAFPTVAPGGTAEWVIAFTNTGETGWDLSKATAVRLGTWSPQDSSSVLASPAWIAPNRPAEQTTTWVGPGQQAWFRVQLRAPDAPGMYRLYVRPVIDGVEWLENVGAYVDVSVR